MISVWPDLFLRLSLSGYIPVWFSLVLSAKATHVLDAKEPFFHS